LNILKLRKIGEAESQECTHDICKWLTHDGQQPDKE